MKPKKFVAATTRAALAKVRESLGDDAVILSNRSTTQGVEVLAIAERDFDSLVGAESVEAIEVEPAHPLPTPHPVPANGTGAQAGRRAGGELAQAAMQASARPGAADPLYTPGYWSGEPEAPKPFRFVDYVRSKLVTKSAAPAGIAGEAGFEPGAERTLMASRPEPHASGKANQAARAAADVLVREHALVGASLGDTQRRKRAASAGGTQPQAGTAQHAAEPVQAPQPTESRPSMLNDARPILDELRSLRDFMAARFDQLAGENEGGVQLVEAMLRRELLGAGFEPMIVRAALESLPAEFAATQARDWVEARLARSLACSSDDIVDSGGVFALTGATGVGKTTTAAKLAARCAVRYGADSVGLITTDTYRIGAPDQLRIYGKILSVPVHTVHDLQWLQRTLETLAGRRLVIIDTMGMGQRDARVSAQLEMLDRCQVKRLLLLAASSQSETQEEVIDLYQGRTGAGAILTKIDETVKLAPALGVLLRYRLKLRYVTNGQRVPEDLQPADAVALMRAALKPPARGAHTERSVERTPHAAAGR